MKPSGLANPCTRCGNLMPFDPQAQNQLCNGCNRLLALGGDFSSDSEEPSFDDNNSYATPPHPTISPQALFNTYFGSSPPTYHNDEYSVPPQPMMDSPSLKRKYHLDTEQQYPSKRLVGNTYAPHTPSTLRQNVWPPTFGTEQTVATETEDEDEPEFVDAQEDQGWDARAGVATGDVESEEGEENADGEVDESGNAGPTEAAAAAADAAQPSEEDEVEEQPVHDEDDLFTQTFGNTNNVTNGEANANESDNEDAPVEVSKDFDRSDFINSLQSSKPTTDLAPKKKAKKPPVPLVSGFLPPLIPHHIARNLRKQHSFHHTALQHLPRLPLAEHRYWIGVLKIGVPPRATTQSERNFTWMKGNRLTTVETIWEAYCLGSAAEEKEGVVLLVGFERPGLRVRCEELDYFNDKRVIFRAVKVTHPDARGRGLCEELVKEVVEIEEEGEGGRGPGEAGEKGKGKGKENVEEMGKGKGKENVKEVIEID